MSGATGVGLGTCLLDLHFELGARLAPFAGHQMPLWYGDGSIAEHHHTRSSAALFDVSHMAIVEVHGEKAAEALERLVPASITGLSVGRLRYTFFTNQAGGIIDDLIVTRHETHISLVLNAARRVADMAHLADELHFGTTVVERTDLALLAIQGPRAVDVLAQWTPEVAQLAFMQSQSVSVAGCPVHVSRSGYTGEDGFELSLPVDEADRLARLLLADEALKPAGLAARDSLRLEAGLCLYGADIDETTTPHEASLAWAVHPRRLTAGDFIGAAAIQGQAAAGTGRLRVGLRPDGRRPVREGPLVTGDGEQAGRVTSGGFGPTVGGPVAMGYVDVAHAAPGTTLFTSARRASEAVHVTALPFVAHRYHRS